MSAWRKILWRSGWIRFTPTTRGQFIVDVRAVVTISVGLALIIAAVFFL